MRVDRRRFLAFAGAAGLGAHAALGGCSKPVAPAASTSVVAAEWARARALGKPLLVVLIPQRGSGPDTSGLFGGLLNCATDELLATLALAEIVCATPEQARDVLGDSGVGGETFALFEERDGRAVSLAASPPALETVGDRKYLRDDAWQLDGVPETEERRAVEALAARLCGLLAPDAAALERRALAARAKLAPGVVAALASSDPFEIAPVDLVDCAALVHEIARVDAVRPPWIGKLARSARERWVIRAPAGARWAAYGGCGTIDVEGLPPEEQEQASMVCGIGFCSELSSRFLWFYGSPRELQRLDELRGR